MNQRPGSEDGQQAQAYAQQRIQDRRCRVPAAQQVIGLQLSITLFSREPGSRTGVDVKLFETWGNQRLPDRYFVENILLFLPFGVLLPAAVPSLRKGWCCVYAAFSTSMMLETVQLLTERGYCQLDDVVTNTLGAAIGYLVFALVRKCWRGKIEE